MKVKIFLLFFLVFLVFGSPVLARKKITRNLSQPSGISIKPKLRFDHRALLLVFIGMDKVDKINYRLTYSSDNIPQGIQGDYNAILGNTQKELVFGTCSKNVCAYHQNIKDMILEIKAQLKSGRVLTQKYSIKP